MRGKRRGTLVIVSNLLDLVSQNDSPDQSENQLDLLIHNICEKLASLSLSPPFFLLQTPPPTFRPNGDQLDPLVLQELEAHCHVLESLRLELYGLVVTPEFFRGDDF